LQQQQPAHLIRLDTQTVTATRHRIGCHFAASSLAPHRCPHEWFTAPNREAKSTFGVSARRCLRGYGRDPGGNSHHRYNTAAVMLPRRMDNLVTRKSIRDAGARLKVGPRVPGCGPGHRVVRGTRREHKRGKSRAVWITSARAQVGDRRKAALRWRTVVRCGIPHCLSAPRHEGYVW